MPPATLPGHAIDLGPRPSPVVAIHPTRPWILTLNDCGTGGLQRLHRRDLDTGDATVVGTLTPTEHHALAWLGDTVASFNFDGPPTLELFDPHGNGALQSLQLLVEPSPEGPRPRWRDVVPGAPPPLSLRGRARGWFETCATGLDVLFVFDLQQTNWWSVFRAAHHTSEPAFVELETAPTQHGPQWHPDGHTRATLEGPETGTPTMCFHREGVESAVKLHAYAYPRTVGLRKWIGPDAVVCGDRWARPPDFFNQSKTKVPTRPAVVTLVVPSTQTCIEYGDRLGANGGAAEASLSPDRSHLALLLMDAKGTDEARLVVLDLATGVSVAAPTQIAQGKAVHTRLCWLDDDTVVAASHPREEHVGALSLLVWNHRTAALQSYWLDTSPARPDFTLSRGWQGRLLVKTNDPSMRALLTDPLTHAEVR